MRAVKIDVIINAHSGSAGQEARRRIADSFAAHGIEANVFVATSGSQVTELAERAAKSNVDAVVAGGGDGTINSVAAAVVGVNKMLGVLPLGTMNHFAKDLHVPLDLERAVATIAAGHTVSIDVGEVNGLFFLNNSSLGLYPSMVRESQKVRRLGWGKWPAYIWASLAVLRRYPFLEIRLGVNGKALTSRTPFVFIGNNQYEMETFNIGSRAGLDRGELSLYMTRDITRLGLIRLALRALFKKLHREKDFLALCTKEVWIGTKRKRIRVAHDGELTVLAPPLHYRVHPKALRVLVPAPSQAGKP